MSRLVAFVSWSSAVVLCAFAPVPASAQEASGEPPAHIAFVDGPASLERDGRNETAPTSMPLLAGDRIRTQNGRVEVLYADGSTLHLDANTLVDFQSDEVVRLLGGRVRLSIAGANRTVGYRVDAPSAWIQIAQPGEYRVAVSAQDEIELAVLRGAADLVNEDGRTSLGAGERAFARVGATPSAAYVFNSAAWDAFDRWSESRRDARLGVSTQYLPETVQPYAATFNQYGYWRSEPTYGHVWYPRVRPGWRPYYHGRWTTLRPWGWTWIGSDPWAWPTHHYGRWGFSAGAWFWIPGRLWGPAWVSWAYAPGYVSWCPLGWNNRPVFQLGYANVYGSRRYYDPWHAWTVVPHRGFGRGDVHINVINASRIDVRTRGSFVVRSAAPENTGYAVPRSSTPIRTAVRRDGPFGGDAALRASPRTGGSVGAPAAQTGGDPTTAFRSRRSSGGSLQGPAYPAPARTPQAVPRERSTPAVGAPVQEYRSRGGSVVTTPERSPAERRAIPRSAPPASAAPAPEVTSPSRRQAPGYRTAPPSADTPPPDMGSRSEGYPRAVPRADRPGNVYAPSPTYGGQRERNPYRAPEASAPDPGPRATPRSAPDGGGVPYRGRSAPSGMDRPAPAPSGPPPSAAPSRGSERPAGSSEGAGSRSRGDGQSTGRAVSRSRGR
jgi:FecR protein